MVDQSAVGRSFTPVTAHVEPGRLRYFLDTLGERNPIYRDAAAARTHGYSAVPVPPTYLFCLEMMDAGQSVRIPDRAQDRSCPRAAWRTALHLPRPRGGRRHADILVRASPSVTDKKGGAMTLVVVETEVTNQHGVHVADCLAHDRRAELEGVMSETAKQHPAVGERLVHKTFPPISRHTLALYCGASGDHNPIHVDIDFAKEAGFPDVFAHGMLVMAYLGQALTDAVPPAGIRSFSTRFAAITQLGARLTCEGHVAELVEHNGERRARLALTTKDENGEIKLAGEAVIAL